MNERTNALIDDLDAKPFYCSEEVAHKLLHMQKASEADPNNPALVPLRWHDAEITAHPHHDTVCCGPSSSWKMKLGGRPLRWDTVFVCKATQLTVLKNIRVRRKSAISGLGISECSEHTVQTAIRLAADEHNIDAREIHWTLDNIGEGVGDVVLERVVETPWDEWRKQQTAAVVP